MPQIKRGEDKGGKQFFFEKKNQKTFVFIAVREGTTAFKPLMNRSFLVLFFKKELHALPFSTAIASTYPP